MNRVILQDHHPTPRQQRSMASSSSSSWVPVPCSQRRKRQPTVVTSLDLHGCRKDQAIRQLTHFFEQVMAQQRRHQHHSRKSGDPEIHTRKTSGPEIHRNCCVWVSIITGTGKHSPNGPVLREAVRALLDKRHMDYQLHPGKGSFLVNANSGHALFRPPPPTTTKLVVVPPTTSMAHVRGGGTNIMHHSRLSASSSTSSLVDPQDPLPSQVAADDALLERVQQESVQDAQRHKDLMKQAETALEQAMVASLLQQEEGNELYSDVDNEYQDQLMQAMQDSLDNSLHQEYWQFDNDNSHDENDDEYQWFLSQVVDKNDLHNEEDEAILQEVLSRSLQDMGTTVAHFEQQDTAVSITFLQQDNNRRSDEESNNEYDTLEEERILQQVLQLSLEETTISHD